MKFESFFNSKFFSVLETLYRIIILNMLTILFTILGLVIFSLVPALIALCITIKSINKDTDFPLFKSYFRSFKNNYRKGMLLSIFFLIMFTLATFNTYYLYCAVNEWGDTIWILLYTFMMMIDCLLVLTFINMTFVCTYFPVLTYFKTIKYSFILVFGEMWKYLIVLILLIGSIYLIALFPYIFPFIVIGLLYYITNLLLKGDYLKIGLPDIVSLDVFTYLK